MSISMLAAIVAMQNELYKRPADIAAMMKWSDNPAVREWGLRLENALLREKKEAVTNCNQFKMREALAYCAKVCGEHINLRDDDDPMNIAHEKAKAALSAPARNCDRQYKNGYDVLGEFTAETGRQIFETVDVINWLFAEAKGDAK